MYKPAEKDFSNYKTKKRRLHAPLKHNFTGDRAGSDIEVGVATSDMGVVLLKFVMSNKCENLGSFMCLHEDIVLAV